LNSDEVIDLGFQQQVELKDVDIISVPKFLLLNFLSFGLYSIWWMYHVWRFLKYENKLDVMPVWRAIFSIFFVYSLFKRILNFAWQLNTKTDTYSSVLLATLFVTLNILAQLPTPFWLISLLTGLCFIQPINVFNHAIETSNKHMALEDNGMSTGQIIVLIVGLFFWILVLGGLYVQFRRVV